MKSLPENKLDALFKSKANDIVKHHIRRLLTVPEANILNEILS